MIGFRFQLIGATQLLKKLDKRNFKSPVDKSIRKITTWYHQTVVVSTPVDKSRLRPSISMRVQGQTGEVFTNIEYAPFVEYGTRKMKARHVDRGSSARRLGKGPFTHALEQLHHKMGAFMGDLAQAIKVRFE